MAKPKEEKTNVIRLLEAAGIPCTHYEIDLPKGESGLKNAVKILNEIEGVAITYFTDRDVVRHELVQRIVLAYAKAEKKHDENEGE